MGRPSTLTPEVQKVILAAIKEGARRGQAAKIAGVAPQTLSGWMRAEGEPYESFAREVLVLEGKLSGKLESFLHKKALTSPTVAMWLLERLHPDEWGRRRLEITGADGGPVAFTFDPRTLTLDQLERIAAGEDPAAVVGGDRGREAPEAPGGGDLRVRPEVAARLRGATAP